MLSGSCCGVSERMTMKRRDWTAAWEKIADDPFCRVCGARDMIDPAHVVPRSRGADCEADAVVGLCRSCHTDYDGGRLELLPHLTRADQVHAVRLVGIAEAYRRTTVRT